MRRQKWIEASSGSIVGTGCQPIGRWLEVESAREWYRDRYIVMHARVGQVCFDGMVDIEQVVAAGFDLKPWATELSSDSSKGFISLALVVNLSKMPSTHF